MLRLWRAGAPTPGTEPSAPSRAGTASPQAAAAPASDFQTFLMLLTAQMRNQDPLKPVESTEFVAQLAGFSAVEQQIASNERLDRIFESLSGGAQGGLAQWIGREVRAPVEASFRGRPIEVEVTPEAGADRAVLVVRNAFDQEVARLAVDPEKGSHVWNGENALGEMQAEGAYRFSLESYRGETLLAAEPGRVFAAVAEVRLEDGAPVLVLEGGGKIAADEVTAVR
ncbi:flagellar hook capping FlgD N-terminal domain-containing protein [soil metagenome]